MYQYLVSTYFKKQIKIYLKKYPSLLDDLITVLRNFDKKTSTSLGAHTYKIRLTTRGITMHHALMVQREIGE